MNTLNKVTLIGNLGTDVRLITGKNSSVATFKVVTNSTYVEKGETKQKSDWHMIVAFGKLADLCAAHIKVGSLVYVEGRLQYRLVKTENEGTVCVAEIKADNVMFLNRPAEKLHSESTDVAVDENGDINGNLK